jgi:aminopeptidase N
VRVQLLAWAVGDFEYVEAMTRRKYNGASIPVRVYTTRGLKKQARFALECAHRTVDYFSELFGIDYPLPKSDLLAVHEFVGCAIHDPFPYSLTISHRLWVPWKTGAS